MTDRFIAHITKQAIKERKAHQVYKEYLEFLSWLDSVSEELEYIIELGVDRGGNLWAMQQIAPHVSFIAVDSNIGKLYSEDYKQGTVFVNEKSADAALKIKKLYVPEKTLVFIDACHHYKFAKKDSQLYASKYQVFHDIYDDKKDNRIPKLFNEFKDKKEIIKEWGDKENHIVGIGVRLDPTYK